MFVSLWLACPWVFAQGDPAKTDATAIGEIVGPDFTVKGEVGISLREGRVVMRLESGNEVTVHRGQALIRLMRGAGSIRLCEPMKVSLLKSAGGLTVAFEQGRLRVDLRGPQTLSLHTPWFTIVAPRVEEPSEAAALAGLDADGKLCLKTLAGEWQVREQLGTGQLAVPAGNEFFIEPNKLTEPRRATDACTCSEERLEEPPVQAAQPSSAPVASVPALNPAGTAQATVAKDIPSETEKVSATKSTPPEWKAIMPPLVYQSDAATSGPSTAPAATGAPAQLILTPATWQGVVTPRANASSEAAKRTSPRGGLVERVKSFFRVLFGRQPKQRTSR